MANNKKITALPALGATPANDDVLPIVDVSGTATTKKVTVANLVAAAAQGDLLASNNLSDVANAGTSRTNLGLGTAATLNVGTSATNVVQLADVSGTVKLPAVDGSQLTNLPGVGDAQLRGTTNPHIGAFPNQSFLVLDNPSKSVMLGSDADGKLYLFNSSGKTAISTGISAVEDSAEPDIEITTTTGTYSLISGDSDAKDPNGLPVQQGFNAPNIGAFSSPLLISGGSIA
tara:strand:- start:147 stop:839 length:693 start_codon:yes stop_codon:yes gene_type:complete